MGCSYRPFASAMGSSRNLRSRHVFCARLTDCRCWKGMRAGTSPPSDKKGSQGSCACYHAIFCCDYWSDACDDCQFGVGNDFGCAPRACPSAMQSESCACKQDPACCVMWDDQCQQCSQGLGSTRGCSLNACAPEPAGIAVRWSYDDQESWGALSSACATGLRQSPISLPQAAGKQAPFLFARSLLV